MDDDCKDYRKNKPQQKLYKPGSGPLRRSRYGSDAKMDSYDLENGHRVRNHNFYGSQNSVNGETQSDSSREKLAPNSRFKKSEQQLYVPRAADSCSDVDKQPRLPGRSDNSSQYNNRRMSNKHDKHGSSGTGSFPRGAGGRDYHYKDGTNNDINFNRHYRQASESRSISPAHSMQENSSVDRNRDSRSMETWAGRQKSGAGGKPPSGRRNSAGYPTDARPKHIVNLENIPPRFRKKFLEQSGHHSFESVDQLNRDRYNVNHMSQSAYNPGQFQNTNAGWSQTLPSRGRGRLRDNEHFDREKFLSSYMRNNDVQHSRRSTPSSSYMNLYDPSISEDKVMTETPVVANSVHDNQGDVVNNVPNNGISNEESHDSKETENEEELKNDSESASHISTNLSDMTNLDWTEEVEKNIKLDDMCDTSTSFSQNIKPTVPLEVKPIESRESKRSGKSRRRDKRSSSRGHKNSEKKPERLRRDSNVSINVYEPERTRKDSNVSIQNEAILSGLKQRERERRDSHKSNRSSTIGNSRDDLDRWRSLRSYSREQSTERRIVSQCNSRDTSTNRAVSPKDSEGFRIPASKSTNWSAAPQKSNGAWGSGRQSSAERRRHSPTPSNVSVSGEGGEGPSGGGRRSRKSGRRRGRNAENVQPITHTHHASTATNWREEILESKKQQGQDRHPENTNQRNRLNSVLSEKSVSDSSTSQPGLIVLPQSSVTDLQKDQGRAGSVDTHKTLYDYHNPSKPIRVQTNSNKMDIRMDRGEQSLGAREVRGGGYEAGEGREAGGGRARGARHTALLQEVDRADAVLKMHTMRGPLALASHWPIVYETRKVLQNALQRLLMSDLKYCQAENVEQKFWKILYYLFIENLRKSVTQVSPEEKLEIVKLINIIIEEGNVFFENLVQMLEKTYKFNTDDYLNDNHATPPKGLGYVGLALISVQKLYVFLGDLARYKEQVNETNNFAKSKAWYTKAQQINPKNGRPYNQLAILAIYARRKLDAVYYYMRSLMSSNPFQSARESLISLFDENRKKFEAAERKRRAALEAARAAEGGEAAAAGGAGGAGGRELWVRPGEQPAARPPPEDTFDNLSTVELNKTFITSYLHVHGKLITKIGMESFHECAALMLRQFRALLHRQPLPTPAARLLQLTALNMFAVETTASSLRDGGSGRSAWLECSLGVSLLMFGALVERCCALLPEPTHSQQHADALLLLPAIKVWSDWMLCHSSIWNPPPSLDNFETESETDPWDWLAKLMNILEELDDKSIELESSAKEGYTCVRLAEDTSLAGFTPLMYMEPAAGWARAEPPVPHHAAEHALRTRKLLFFGTEYLVGVEPPVLKLEYPADAQPRYVSAVERAQPHYPQLQHLSEDSGQEDSQSELASGQTSLSEGLEEVPEAADEATRRLLRRKEQLETRKATLEKRRQRMQEMLGAASSAEVEVRPRWLVPDTNCFIDHLPLLQAVVAAPGQPYQLAVPLVVVTELEGLRRCARVGGAARGALGWVRGAAGVRLATARGSLLASRAFTAEEHARACNDDRVLATALNLHANVATLPDAQTEAGAEPKRSRIVREVVLLTDDRNLRVKALAAELPARDLPSFAEWAGIAPIQAAEESQPATSNEEAPVQN
ncbi:uncharacterized protein Smg6 isoform X2 [Epargyreus clarus]|uniref:uncharacterized protein Smg6 isoform X2 n=1 Tax=Epargyreus clarus TaxID=520877 RepID=UPI003C2ABB45